MQTFTRAFKMESDRRACWAISKSFGVRGTRRILKMAFERTIFDEITVSMVMIAERFKNASWPSNRYFTRLQENQQILGIKILIRATETSRDAIR